MQDGRLRQWVVGVQPGTSWRLYSRTEGEPLTVQQVDFVYGDDAEDDAIVFLDERGLPSHVYRRVVWLRLDGEAIAPGELRDAQRVRQQPNVTPRDVEVAEARFGLPLGEFVPRTRFHEDLHVVLSAIELTKSRLCLAFDARRSDFEAAEAGGRLELPHPGFREAFYELVDSEGEVEVPTRAWIDVTRS